MSSNKQNNTSIKKINNILKFGSYFLVFILPIFYIGITFYPFTASKTFLLYGFVEILIAFWIYAFAVDKSYRLSYKTLFYFIPLVLFIIWMSIAGVLAVNPSLSLWSSIGRGTGLLTLYHCLAFALIVASLIKHNGTNYLYKLMHWFINSSVILALSVLFGNEGFNSFKFLAESNGGGLMGNSSLTAALLMFSLAFGFFLFTSKNKSGNKWWLGIKMAIILFSPLYINIYGLFVGNGILGVARGATLGLILGVGATGVLYLFFSKKKIFRIVGVIGIIIGIALFYVGWSQLEKPDTFIHQKFTEAASGTRFIFSETSQKAIDKHPWFGYGPENFPIAFQENLNPQMALASYGFEVWDDRAHNIYYDTGVSGGYPAIVFYSLFVLSILYGLYKLRDREEFNHTQIAILGGLIIGYVFQNLYVFDSALSISALYIVAGVVFVSHEKLNEDIYIFKPKNSFIKYILPIILSISCLISLIIFVWRPLKKAFAYYSVINTPIDIRASHYNDLLEGPSIGEDWDVSGMAYDIYKYYNSDSVKLKNDSKLLPYAISDIKGLIKYLEVVQNNNKSDVRLGITIISLYNTLNYLTDNPYNPVLGDHIFKIFDHIKTISPNNPSIYWILAQTYLWKADYNGMLDSYKSAIALDPSIPESYRLLLNFAKNTGNQKLYDESLFQAQKDIPNFPPN